MFWKSTVLPVRGGVTISARWPLPIGATISMTRDRQILSSWILNFELQALVGIERGQVVEMDLVPGLLRVLEVDGVAFKQREIPFSLLGAPDDAFDRIAGSIPSRLIREGDT